MKVAVTIIMSLLLAYVGSYEYQKGWPFADHIDVGGGSVIFALTEDIRMNAPCCRQDPNSKYYSMKKKEQVLFTLYYPLVKIDRLFGNYYVFDENLPNMGG